MNTLLQWFLSNSLLVVGVLLALIIIFGNKLPSIATWQAFLDSFESKGGQLMLLWVTDFIVLAVLVHYWKGFDAQLQTTIVGLLSGVNGAFLGAIGARNPTPSNGGGPITDSSVPSPGGSQSPAAPRGDAGGAAPAPVAATPAAKSGSPLPVGIGVVGEHGHVGDLGTNQPSTAK